MHVIDFDGNEVENYVYTPHDDETCCTGCKAQNERIEQKLDAIQATIANVGETFTAGVNEAMGQLADGGFSGLIKGLMGR